MPDNLEQMLKKISIATYYGEVQFIDTNSQKLGDEILIFLSRRLLK